MPSIKKDQINSISFSQNPQTQTEPQTRIHCNTTVQHPIIEQGDRQCYVYFNTRSAMVSWLLRHFVVVAWLPVGRICGHKLGTMVVLWYLKVGLWWIWVWRCWVSIPIFFKNLKSSELTPRLFHHRTRQKHLEEHHQKKKKKPQPQHKSIRSN